MEQLGIAMGERAGAFAVWLSNPITQLVFAPLLGSILIMLTNRKRTALIKLWAILGSGLSLLAAILMVTGLPEMLTRLSLFEQYGAPFRPEVGLQFAQEYSWFRIVLGEAQSFSVNYAVAVDGLSMPLVLLGSAVVFLAVVWSLSRTERVRDYFALTLLMATGLLGVFVALDYVLFYLFWELMLVPMFFLIAGWGPNRARAGKAAIKFFIYTMAGSVFMLIAFIALKVLSLEPTFSIISLTQYHLLNFDVLHPTVRTLIFCGLLLGFAVKIPMFPFHTWLPDAHTEAPTEMSVILAAVMLKTGAYAYLRILYPTFPDVAYTLGPVLAFCGVVAIVYGAAVTLVQTDLKRLVAYSSISHMGFIVLGISALNPDAFVGAVFQMVAHGIVISTLFFLCGVIERRYGTRNLHELGGLLSGAPSYATVLGVAAFAGMGLPGLVSFWGEFLVLKGTFFNNENWASVQVGVMDASRFMQIAAIVAVLGVLGSAVYMINMLQRVLPGEDKLSEFWRGFKFADGVVLVPLTAAIVVLGLYPRPVIDSCIYYANALWQTVMQF